MKTEISKFCEAYLSILNALPPALKNAAEQMEKGGDKALLQRPLASLNDIRARLRSLVEKIESQQAYLVIFGPLKSGKSTLMNAISGAYVSEVTSLPGYPCLVYVRHGHEPHFSVTHYNGRESVFADGHVLKDVIADAHIALAEQIHCAEARGVEFNPGAHFSEAIRRVDVKVPVQTLAESSTVLVDTPGLYSRMNFGYDVLTREFRDSAACAVFVVKTDNLYLEQVFAEFNQLLGLFSRIFLVINTDSSKRDLQADGSLLPSAESRNPQQIIDAFKTLSMAGPLRQAYEDKRLRIHAVDLLSAASVFLTRNGNGEHAAGTAENEQKVAFDAFLDDLTDYLNSNDYSQEFVRDSLRQGSALCAEVHEVCEGDAMLQLAEKQAELTGEMRGIRERIAAVDRLTGVDWDATFEKVRVENASQIDQSAKGKTAEVTKEMGEALDRWYGVNDGLQALAEQHWNPLLADAARALADETRSRLHSSLGGSLGGAEPAASVMTDLHTAGFDLGLVGRAVSSALDGQEAIDSYRTMIKGEDVPVRKSFADWLLFRRGATVRRRVFGAQLTQEIAAEVKKKRLPETTKAAFLGMIESTIKERFPLLPAKFSDMLTADYVTKFRGEVLDRLRQQREQLVKAHAELQAPFDVNASILASMRELDGQASKVADEIIPMAQRGKVVVPLNSGEGKAAPLDEGKAAPLPEAELAA